MPKGNSYTISEKQKKDGETTFVASVTVRRDDFLTRESAQRWAGELVGEKETGNG